MAIKITHKQIKDSIEVSIDDGVNNLGIKFVAPQSDFTSETGLDKIFNAMENYLNQNYICQHERRHNGLKIIDIKNGNN